MKLCARLKAIFVFLIFCAGFINAKSQGLQFKALGLRVDRRASYNVFEKKSPVFRKEMQIGFRLSYTNPRSFGYILSLSDEIPGQAYNIIYLHDEGRGYLKFNLEGRQNLATFELDREKLFNKGWFKVTLIFSSETQKLTIKVDDQAKTIQASRLPTEFEPVLVFGLNKHSVDLPSFEIQELAVQNEEEAYFFPLNESDGKWVHDKSQRIIGKVSNPMWRIKESYYWKKRYMFSSKDVSGVSFDQADQKMLFFNKDSLLDLSLRDYSSTTRVHKNKPPVRSRLGMSFIDTANKHLYVYEVSDLPDQSASVARLDISKGLWQSMSKEELPMQLHQHAGFFDVPRDRYLIFGGFGNQRYSSETVSYKIKDNKWDTVFFSGDKISPRYFTSSGVNKDGRFLYIFGGAGNESGDQTLGRLYFYDLYKIDLRSNHIKKMWDLKWKSPNMVPTRNMIVTDSSLFALCYPEYQAHSALQLYKFSISDGTYRVYGDSIPIFSDKITTNASLYYNTLLNEFYCTVQEFEDDGSSVTTLYSLSAPPISKADLLLYKDNGRGALHWLSISAAVFLVLALGIYLRKKKKVQTSALITQEEEILPVYEKKSDRINSIYLLGSFTIYDQKGKDITYLMSNRLRQAFLLILHHSFHGGITSAELSGKIWPEKDEYSVKNLRGVTLNQLRKVLQELEGVELVYDKKTFKIQLNDRCYCDYAALSELLGSSNRFSEPDAAALLGLLRRGTFLSDSDFPAIRAMKASVQYSLQVVLQHYIDSSYSSRLFALCSELASALLSTDPSNEKALARKVAALYRSGRESEARECYSRLQLQCHNLAEKSCPSFSSIISER